MATLNKVFFMEYISGVVLEKHNQLKRTDQSLRIKLVTIILQAIFIHYFYMFGL